MALRLSSRQPVKSTRQEHACNGQPSSIVLPKSILHWTHITLDQNTDTSNVYVSTQKKKQCMRKYYWNESSFVVSKMGIKVFFFFETGRKFHSWKQWVMIQGFHCWKGRFLRSNDILRLCLFRLKMISRNYFTPIYVIGTYRKLG